jgi:aryl-alcohol dehydrogenase-like predicted oxidoreductase
MLQPAGAPSHSAPLGWLWPRTERAIPIPGFRTVAQVDENCGALVRGPLTDAQMGEIDRVLAP